MATQELVFYRPSGLSISLNVVNLDLISQDHTLVECRLIVQIDLPVYQQLTSDASFNLKPELRGALNVLEFQNEPGIEIEVTLQPQLLPQLAEHAINTETAIAHLIACSQELTTALSETSTSKPTNESPNIHPASHPLLSTESWFALSVKQTLESGEIGYRTFWSYLNPVSLTPEAIAGGQFPEAMEQFLKERNEGNIALAGQVLSEALDGITNDFKKKWDETELVKQTESALENLFSEVTNAFEDWREPSQGSKIRPATKGRIYQTMLNFFSEEDWEFTKLQGQLILRLACEGKNGSWNCFAIANESRQRFLFYSVGPLEIPASDRNAIAEFLTRANYGIEIGNFELDFHSGEIRYKTSIDVQGDRLTPALIKSLVYTNVLTMDQYLPGIQAVLAGSNPQDAIQAIEQSASNVPTSTDL